MVLFGHTESACVCSIVDSDAECATATYEAMGFQTIMVGDYHMETSIMHTRDEIRLTELAGCAG